MSVQNNIPLFSYSGKEYNNNTISIRYTHKLDIQPKVKTIEINHNKITQYMRSILFNNNNNARYWSKQKPNTIKHNNNNSGRLKTTQSSNITDIKLNTKIIQTIQVKNYKNIKHQYKKEIININRRATNDNTVLLICTIDNVLYNTNNNCYIIGSNTYETKNCGKY